MALKNMLVGLLLKKPSLYKDFKTFRNAEAMGGFFFSSFRAEGGNLRMSATIGNKYINIFKYSLKYIHGLI